MGKTFLKETAKLMQDKTKKKRWHRIVISLSLVVALTTSYLLIEPAITMERTPECGIEEHTHTAECYERQLVCGQEERESIPATEEKVLNCPLEVHEHTAECYDEEGNLICGHEEHVHNDSCYQIVSTPGVEGHTHTDACYQDVLVCQKPEHVHSAECYPSEEPEAEEPTVTEEPAKTEETPEEVTYEACVLRGDGADYNVQVECSAEAQIPSDATVSVRELKKDTTPQEYDNYYNSALSKVSQLTGKTITYARIFDVKIYDANGNQIQPAVPVTLKFTYYSASQNPSGNEVKAVYFGNETQLLNVETNEYNQAWNEAVVRNVSGVSVFVIGGIAAEQKTEEPVAEPVVDETVTEEPAADDTVAEEPSEEHPEDGVIIEGEDQTEETGKADDAEVVDIVEDQPQDADASQETPDAEAADGENNNADNENPDANTTDGENPDGEAQDSENVENPDGDTVDPENPDAQDPEDGTTEDPDAETTEAPAEDADASEENGDAEEVEFADGTLAFEGSDYTVQLSYTAGAQVPADAELNVREIEKGTDEYQNYYQQAMAAVEDGDTTSIADARFFDITILVNGEEFEPAAPVEVKVSYHNAVEVPQDGDVKSVHFGDENTQVLDVQTNENDGAVNEVTFAADSFSVYGIVTREVLTGDVITADGETYTVTVSYGPEAKIPAGATLRVNELDPDSAAYQAEYNNAEALLNSENADLHVFQARFFDVSIMNGEEEVQPQADVNVEISAQNVTDDGEGLFVTHTHDNETVLVDAETEAVGSEETKFTFSVDSFSNIGTVSAGKTVSMVVGDTATLISDTENSYWSSSNTNCIKINSSTSTSAEIEAVGTGTAYVYHRYSNYNYYETYTIAVKTSLQYTATFDGNGNTSGKAPNSITITRDANNDTELVFPDARTLAKKNEVFIGWSTASDVNTGDGVTFHRIRIYQPGETCVLTANTTYYAIWATKDTKSVFYIRLDGKIPMEPGAVSDEANYNCNNYTPGVAIDGALKVAKFYANTTGVDDNLNTSPTAEQIKEMLDASRSTLGFDVKVENGKVIVSRINNSATNAQHYNVSVNDELYVVWYVCKKAIAGNNVNSSKYTLNNWHVDGVLLTKAKVTLVYDPGLENGTSTSVVSNMPLGSQHNVGTNLQAGIDSDLETVRVPVRSDGYVFSGWKMYTKDETTGEYTVYRGDYASEAPFVINEDTKLVAQWVKDVTSLTIIKVDQDEQSKRLPSAKFILTPSVNNNTEFVTGENGQIVIPKIELNTIYTLTEAEAPIGYAKLLNSSIYFKEIKDGNTYQIKFYSDASGSTEIASNEYVKASVIGKALQIQVGNRRETGKLEFIKKADGTEKTLLPGAQFGLYDTAKCEGDAKYTGISDDNGKVSFANIPTGTYYMKEMSAPADYVLDETVYEVVINNDSSSIKKMENGVASGEAITEIINKLQRTDIKIEKVDEYNNKIVTAVFKLTKANGDSAYSDITDEKVKNQLDANSSITINEQKTYTITDLPNGSYRLTETSAPSGYIILNKTIDFKIENGEITSTNADGTNVKFDSATNTFTIKNVAGKELPNTGGPGTLLYTLSGILLIIAAALMYGFVLRRRRGRRISG